MDNIHDRSLLLNLKKLFYKIKFLLSLFFLYYSPVILQEKKQICPRNIYDIIQDQNIKKEVIKSMEVKNIEH